MQNHNKNAGAMISNVPTLRSGANPQGRQRRRADEAGARRGSTRRRVAAAYGPIVMVL